MRIGVISDVHANLIALEAVLSAIQPIDQLWCLGDIVGYGPQPNDCVDLLVSQPKFLAVAGNHDYAAIGRIGIEAFNRFAALAAQWTAEQLRPTVREYLAALPTLTSSGEFTLAHGSPRGPLWEYILNARTAQANFEHFHGPFCLVGHTHVPAVFTLDPAGDVQAHRVAGEAEVSLARPGWRFILNPGGVGQPRDGDPRAAFLVVDTERATATWRRVSYDVERTQRLMRRVHLPDRLADRLAQGH
ncbi:MAG: metallophosphoesterase family protein [Chloroflexi bacterium]|nr:metallophosphoesterase family protein [Chloroflexota bacterium]